MAISWSDIIEASGVASKEIHSPTQELSDQEFLTRSLRLIAAAEAEISLNEISNDFTQTTGLRIFATIVRDRAGREHFGYSMGADGNAQLISIAEAVERFAYIAATEVVRDPTANMINEPIWTEECADQDAITAYSISNLTLRKVPARIILASRRPFPTTSSGNAVHLSYRRAYEAGLLELWERHILIRNWLLARAPRKWADPYLAVPSAVLHLMSKYGFDTDLLYYGLDQAYPVCIRRIYKRDGTFPAIFYGTGPGANIGRASAAATAESVRLWAMNFFSILDGQVIAPNPIDQAIRYYDPAQLKILNHAFFDGPQADAQSNSATSLQSIEEQLKPLVVAIAPFSDNEGVPAVRVFSPIGIPLFFGTELPTFPPLPANRKTMPAMLVHPY